MIMMMTLINPVLHFKVAFKLKRHGYHSPHLEWRIIFETSLLIDMFTSSIVTNGPIWHMEKEKYKRWYTWNMHLKYIDL